MCQLCVLARAAQRLKSRPQEIQNKTQLSAAILRNKTLNSREKK
jgi:hypothetical protein